MNTAFLFPGQASQYVGMGKDLYDHSVSTRELFDRADSVLPFDLKRLCFDGPNEELTQTRVTQPAIFVVSVAASHLVSPRMKMHTTAGHSLGEYSALTTAGAIDFEDALRLVALRGKLMQNAGDERPGTMAAVIGLDEAGVRKLCDESSTATEVVVPANFNSPGQIAISGDVSAVDRAVANAKDAGARIAKKLNVSGAFHSPLMEPAAEELAAKVQATEIRTPDVPVYLNVTAQPSTDPGEIRRRLIEQLTHPVLWEQTLQNMQTSGKITRFVEVGPGNVLQGLAKRTLTDVNISSAGTVEAIEQI